MTKRRSARAIGQLVLALALLLVCLPTAQADPPGTQGSDAPSNMSATAVGWVVSPTPVGGYGTIIHTRDGGNTWERQGTVGEIPNVLLNGVWAVDPNNVWVVGGSDNSYGVILRSSDGGNTWTRQGAGQIPDVELGWISAVDNNTAWAVGDQGVILHTRDGGNTWTRQTGGTVPNVGFDGVYAVDARTAWACGAVSAGYGTMLRTTDGGNTWQRPGYTQLPAGHACISVHALDADTAWVTGVLCTSGTDYGVILHTEDGGSKWSKQPTPVNVAWWGVSFVDGHFHRYLPLIMKSQ